MKKEHSITLFHRKEVRRYWDQGKELWNFSIVDVSEIVIGSKRPRKYRNDFKVNLTLEVSELFEKIG